MAMSEAEAYRLRQLEAQINKFAPLIEVIAERMVNFERQYDQIKSSITNRMKKLDDAIRAVGGKTNG
jgi:predicted  nucleic acid-binding Zn-ribbon protein